MEPSDKKAKVSLSHSHSYKEAFKKVFPELVKELTEEGVNDPEISDGMRHLERVNENTEFVVVLNIIVVYSRY